MKKLFALLLVTASSIVMAVPPTTDQVKNIKHIVLTNLADNLNDPDSYVSMDWFIKPDGSNLKVVHRFRSKVPAGGYSITYISGVYDQSGEFKYEQSELISRSEYLIASSDTTTTSEDRYVERAKRTLGGKEVE